MKNQYNESVQREHFRMRERKKEKKKTHRSDKRYYRQRDRKRNSIRVTIVPINSKFKDKCKETFFFVSKFKIRNYFKRKRDIKKVN